jgi:hypothetical protein
MQEALITQLCQESLGVLQVGGIEAFGEPVVNVSEHRARFIAAASVAE